MYGKVISACLQGIEGQLIEVEVDISSGLPQVNLVGLPDPAIRESVERVRSAIKNCGYRFPMDRITVNLAPADLRKEGSSFDLAIAIGILAASGQIALAGLDRCLLLGELSLDGALRANPGVVSMAHTAKQLGVRRIILPLQHAEEACLIDGIDVYGIRSLAELQERGAGDFFARHVFNNKNDQQAKQTRSGDEHAQFDEDYSDVCGQHHAKRAMMIAAAGLHNVLLIGPPGTGKTMLVKRMPGILPPMTEEEALEVTKIYSVSGKLADRSCLMRRRPYRAPHHTTSPAGLAGGGSSPKPGEASLAHRGILFLDELPEFSRNALEVLRQPLEERRITIGRARAALTFPAHFLLAGSMNPFPCGYWGAGDEQRPCTCSPLKRMNYRAKISGPLLDRIDLHVEVPKPSYAQLQDRSSAMGSREMAERVGAAHREQLRRYQGTAVAGNSELTGKLLRQVCALSPACEELLRESFEALGLSARAHDRILRIARTIADLEQSGPILPDHLAEAIQYRKLDKKLEAHDFS